MPRSLFQTKTFQGAAIAFASGLVSILIGAAPIVERVTARHLPEHQEDIQDGLALVMVVCGALGIGGSGAAIMGRLDAGGVYTPDYLPGPNERDFDDRA